MKRAPEIRQTADSAVELVIFLLLVLVVLFALAVYLPDAS